MTNKYFNFNKQYSEHDLVQQLITESISIYGVECFYLPCKRDNINQLYMEDPLSYFDEKYQLDLYVKSYDGFGGNNDIFTKFGITNTDQATFTVSRYAFSKQTNRKFLRPMEGDLIYFPTSSGSGFFEIKFVNDSSIFYQLGEFYIYDLQCERYSFQDNNINVELSTIDDTAKVSQQHTIIKLVDQYNNGDYIQDELVYQGNSVNNYTARATVYNQNVIDKNANNKNVYIFDGGFSNTNTDKYAYIFNNNNPDSDIWIEVNALNQFNNIVDITNSLHTDILANYISMDENGGIVLKADNGIPSTLLFKETFDNSTPIAEILFKLDGCNQEPGTEEIIPTYSEYLKNIDTIIENSPYIINNPITIAPNELFDIELDVINKTNNFVNDKIVYGQSSKAEFKVLVPVNIVEQNTGKQVKIKEEVIIDNNNNAGNEMLNKKANFIIDFDELNPFAE